MSASSAKFPNTDPHIIYKGNWLAEANPNTGGDWPTVHSTNALGVSLTFQFKGMSNI